MLEFIKKLFSSKEGKRTVAILNDDGSEKLTSYNFAPRDLWLWCISIVAGIFIFAVLLMMFTPVGRLVPASRDLRQSVIALQQQVEALQDSMRARNMQLQNLRRILFSGKEFDDTPTGPPVTHKPSANERPQAADQPDSVKEFSLSGGALMTSKLLQNSVVFPAGWPVEGTLTRTYNMDSGHLGIDIATEEGARVHAIAAGVVIGKNWTLNYGYVLYVQHKGGIVTVYKHMSETAVEIGDLVVQGEVLGRVGDVGIISSGPHLHMEIWVNGIAQNPLQYLVKT